MVVEAIQIKQPQAASQIYERFLGRFPTAVQLPNAASFCGIHVHTVVLNQGRYWAAYAEHEIRQKNWEKVIHSVGSCTHHKCFSRFKLYSANPYLHVPTSIYGR